MELDKKVGEEVFVVFIVVGYIFVGGWKIFVFDEIVLWKNYIFLLDILSF